MLDLCKIFGVEKGEKFKIDGYEDIYFIENGYLYYIGDYGEKKSYLNINDVAGKNVIKLPKKKEFTDDELCILRNIDKKYKWITRDKVDRDEYDNYGNLNIYLGEPNKSTVSWLPSDEYCEFHAYNHLFQSIKWEDEEPVYIDDYVNRQNEVK